MSRLGKGSSGLGKRDKFSQPTAASQNASAIISSAKETVRQAERIPLSRITQDPGNHRHIPVDWDNPGAEILDTDPEAAEKRDFLEKLRGLADTIKSAGLINPCVVARQGSDYHLRSGQRRFLAHRLNGETHVFCVIEREAGEQRVRLQQFVENHQREEPSLGDRLRGVMDMLDEAGIEIHLKEPVLQFLQKSAGIGRSQSYLWQKVLAGHQDVRMAILNGTIVALRDAAQVAGYEGEQLEAALTQLAAANDFNQDAGQSEEQPGSNGSSDAATVPPPPQTGAVRANAKRIFRPVRNMVMKTSNTAVTKTIMQRVMGPEFVDGVNFDDINQVNSMFKRMVETLDKQLSDAS